MNIEALVAEYEKLSESEQDDFHKAISAFYLHPGISAAVLFGLGFVLGFIL